MFHQLSKKSRIIAVVAAAAIMPISSTAWSAAAPKAKKTVVAAAPTASVTLLAVNNTAKKTPMPKKGCPTGWTKVLVGSKYYCVKSFPSSP